MQHSLGDTCPYWMQSRHTKAFRSFCLPIPRMVSSAVSERSQLPSVRLSCQQSRHCWRQQASSASNPPSSSDKPEAGAAKELKSDATASETYDLLPLEELQRASDGATEGPIDSTEPSSSKQDTENKASKTASVQKAVSFTALLWNRLVNTLTVLLARIVAFLSWIPAVARHRKLAKLKADLHGNPLAPDK